MSPRPNEASGRLDAILHNGAVLAVVTRLPFSRLAAVAIAVVLSGSGRLVVEAADGGRHRCTCARGAHDCSCPTCLGAERRAHAEDARPPCHRGAAASRGPEHRARPDAPSPSPCLRSGCSGEDAAARLALPSTEAFLVPPPPVLPFTGTEVEVAVLPGRPAEVAARPRVPPPRASPVHA
jgi:hypothetical protein